MGKEPTEDAKKRTAFEVSLKGRMWRKGLSTPASLSLGAPGAPAVEPRLGR